MSKKKILIIEDESDIRDSLQELLELEGMDVVVAQDGQHGLEQLDAHPSIQIILLDLMMPRMNGWQFLEKLKETPQAGTPVIVISAAGGNQKPVTAKAYIKKPMDLTVLLDTIQQLSG